ncbi:MAG: metallophosphoesterase [Nitrospirae bacterium]|nr:metallophosphoesterase [Nitrospirota bacterium]
MFIGIISDTHDNLPAIHKAVAILNERKVEHVIHAGDFCSPFTFRALKHLQCDFTGIYGNNDGERVLLQKLSQGRIFTQPYVLELAEKKIVIMHEQHVVEALAESNHFDLIVYGHTHTPDIRKQGNTLIVNPGELSGWLYGKSTMAIADLSSLSAELLEL